MKYTFIIIAILLGSFSAYASTIDVEFAECSDREYAGYLCAKVYRIHGDYNGFGRHEYVVIWDQDNLKLSEELEKIRQSAQAHKLTVEGVLVRGAGSSISHIFLSVDSLGGVWRGLD